MEGITWIDCMIIVVQFLQSVILLFYLYYLLEPKYSFSGRGESGSPYMGTCQKACYAQKHLCSRTVSDQSVPPSGCCGVYDVSMGSEQGNKQYSPASFGGRVCALCGR